MKDEKPCRCPIHQKSEADEWEAMRAAGFMLADALAHYKFPAGGNPDNEARANAALDAWRAALAGGEGA